LAIDHWLFWLFAILSHEPFSHKPQGRQKVMAIGYWHMAIGSFVPAATNRPPTDDGYFV